jgi:hypothetical protein
LHLHRFVAPGHFELDGHGRMAAGAASIVAPSAYAYLNVIDFQEALRAP